MPIYEFSCKKCKVTFEELVFNDTTPACPECGSTQTSKLISCARLHTQAPSRIGQTVSYPSTGRSGCASCSGGNCSGCGS